MLFTKKELLDIKKEILDSENNPNVKTKVNKWLIEHGLDLIDNLLVWIINEEKLETLSGKYMKRSYSK